MIVFNKGYTHENKCVERLAETAIGKVMISLAYDYDFSGNVIIYIDNMGATNSWNSIPKNSTLAKHFESVAVKHINRKFNKSADKLCRQAVFLCMPKSTYESFVYKCCEYDNMKKQKDTLLQID